MLGAVKGWRQRAGTAVLVTVAFVATACSAPSTRAGAPATHAGVAPSSTDDDLSGPGSPTVHGGVVPTGSGGAAGTSACRSGNPLANVYHPNRLQVRGACVTVSGTVESVRSEDDGDVHFDMALDPAFLSMLTSANTSGQHGWLVAEIVPADEPGCTPGTPPRPPTGTYDYGVCTGADERAPAVGSHVFVTGPSVLDEAHGGWAEIHPVWALSTTAPSPAQSEALPGTTAAVAPMAPAPTVAAAPVPSASPRCTASISNPTPGDSGDETVSVASNLPGAAGTASVHYKTTTHPFGFTTDGAGNAQVTFSIGHPTVGYTVDVDVTLSGGAACSTAFTPG